MNITGVIWQRDIVYKLLWKHGITTDEVEEVFANEPRYKLQEKGTVKGENLYTAYGHTDAGRYLTVFFIYKRNHEGLIITARDMDRKERRRYAKT
ncbi:MAG: BrnT family toxin [Candidatus Latescibacteria bacterium]|nr:BrnT family toxin [Candidatus Latescibacterota bacterium]